MAAYKLTVRRRGATARERFASLPEALTALEARLDAARAGRAARPRARARARARAGRAGRPARRGGRTRGTRRRRRARRRLGRGLHRPLAARARRARGRRDGLRRAAPRPRPVARIDPLTAVHRSLRVAASLRPLGRTSLPGCTCRTSRGGRSSVALCRPKLGTAVNRSEVRSWSRPCAWRRTSAWASRSSTGCTRTLIAMRLADGSASTARTRADLLRVPAVARGLHHRRARRAGGLRRFADDHLHPVMYGSGRRGPEAGCSARCPTRTARRPCARFRLPAGSRGWRGSTRPHLTAACEVAGMLADGAGLPSVGRGPARPPHRALGRQGTASAERRVRRSRCRCGSSMSPSMPPSSGCSAARSAPCASSASAPEHAFDPEVAACLADDAAGILALDADGFGVGGGARL